MVLFDAICADYLWIFCGKHKTNGLHRQREKPDLKPFIVQCIVTKTIPALWQCKSTKYFSNN